MGISVICCTYLFAFALVSIYIWDLADGPKTNELILVPARPDIGHAWAVYYSKRFESEGITHFAVKVMPGTSETS